MKKINFILSTGLIIIFIMFNSCKKWIDPGMNVDPNNPATVSLATLLPATQIGLAYSYGGDLGYAALMWTQQLAGGANQALSYDRYNFKPGDVDNAWAAGMYGGAMTDINNLINLATAQNSPWYRGVAEIEMAIAIGAMTDLFGDVPYSQAWKSPTITTPIFDPQKSIYVNIFKLLQQAKTDMLQSQTSISKYPTTDDLIYGGDLKQWAKVANALEARFAIHLSIVAPDTAYTTALKYLANGLKDYTDDFAVTFGTGQSNSNPFYQFNYNRGGDIGNGAFMIDTMVKISDPRLIIYYDSTNFYKYGNDIYVGLTPGSGGYNYNGWGPTFVSPNSPIVFMSYVEQKFIEAEAQLQTGHADLAADAYNLAVKKSLAKYGVSNSTWENQYANETAGTINLKKIIYQKYLGLNLQFEVFNDYRRTGLPVLKLAEYISPSISHIPYRYPYGQSEINYNPHCPNNINIFVDKIPWMDAALWNATKK